MPGSNGNSTKAHKEAAKSMTGNNKNYTEADVGVVKRILKPDKNFYQVLGVRNDATAAQIKVAFNKLIRKVHPDKNKAPGANAASQRLIEASANLSNDEKRKKYDVFLQSPSEISPGEFGVSEEFVKVALIAVGVSLAAIGVGIFLKWLFSSSSDTEPKSSHQGKRRNESQPEGQSKRGRRSE